VALLRELPGVEAPGAAGPSTEAVPEGCSRPPAVAHRRAVRPVSAARRSSIRRRCRDARRVLVGAASPRPTSLARPSVCSTSVARAASACPTRSWRRRATCSSRSARPSPAPKGGARPCASLSFDRCRLSCLRALAARTIAAHRASTRATGNRRGSAMSDVIPGRLPNRCCSRIAAALAGDAFRAPSYPRPLPRTFRRKRAPVPTTPSACRARSSKIRPTSFPPAPSAFPSRRTLPASASQLASWTQRRTRASSGEALAPMRVTSARPAPTPSTERRVARAYDPAKPARPHF
jgi:hypothetical protein